MVEYIVVQICEAHGKSGTASMLRFRLQTMQKRDVQ